MSQSPHKEYGHQLRALALGPAIGNAIADAGATLGWWSGEKDWFRLYERFDPHQSPYASMVHATQGAPQTICYVEVFESRPETHGRSWIVFDADIGWIKVRQFPNDEVLTTLQAVVSSASNPVVVQYWPQRRCTIRSCRDGVTRFAKVYPKKYLRNNRGMQLQVHAEALWDAAESGRLNVAVAKPAHWDSESRSLWQDELAGQPAESTLLQSGECLASRMGRAAASLPSCGVQPTRRIDGAEQMKDSTAIGKELSRRLPSKNLIITVLLDALELLHAGANFRPLRPVHGDMHAGQWLLAPATDQLGLLDFDDFSWGDPERDVAHFLVQLEYEHRDAKVGKLKEAFLDSYEDIAGPLDRPLLAAYQAHKWLAKALKSSRELRCDGDLRAGFCIEQALNQASVGSGFDRIVS
jgi:phosphotransferase family enzyme